MSEPSPLEEGISRTQYFQQCLNDILAATQSSYYCLKLVVKVLLHGPDGSGKCLLARHAAKSLGMTFCLEHVSDLFDENMIGTEKKVKASLLKSISQAPCIIYFSGYQLFNQIDDQDIDRVEHCIRDTFEQCELTQPVIFVASTNSFDEVYKSPLSHMFHREVAVQSPDTSQAQEMLDKIFQTTEIPFDTDLTKTCLSGDLYIDKLLEVASKAEFRFRNSEVGGDGVGFEEDLDNNLDSEIRWEDVGGLSDVKQEIIDAIQLSIDYPQLKDSGLRRTGVLLYGPPGTGKTLLAKTVANECNLSFISVKGPELLNEYVGQSEENIRRLFARARESSPSVIFFDEIDSLAPNRGQAGDSGGVMDRTVSQILAEMDGVGKSEDVFVIGATNRVDLVDSSLLRPGRFDKVLEVPLPKGKDNRLQILRALTRKMNLSRNIDLEKVESMAPGIMSGADFRGLCSMALQLAFDRCIEQVESGKATEADVDINITMEDFVSSIRGLEEG